MLIFDEADETFVNDGTIEEDVLIRASGVIFTNTAEGRINGQFIFEVGGSTLIHEAGAVINAPFDPDLGQLPAVIGSAGIDTVIADGVLAGSVDLGAGDDLFSIGGVRSPQGGDFDLNADGGEGVDTLEIRSFEGTSISSISVEANELTGFEILSLGWQQFGGNYIGLSGFEQIVSAPDASQNFLDSQNPEVDLNLNEGRWSFARGSTIGSITGTDAGEFLGLSDDSRVIGAIDLGGGSDILHLEGGLQDQATRGQIFGGGGNVDQLFFNLTSLETDLNAEGISGFETLDIRNLLRPSVDQVEATLTNASGFQSITLSGIDLTVSSGDYSSTVFRTIFSSSTILFADGLTIAGYYGLDFADEGSGIIRSVTNHATFTGDVAFGAGGDFYDGQMGSVLGAVFGNAGDDEIIGGALGETFFGGSGNDILRGNGGGDRLAGGLGNDAIDGGENVDTAVFSGNRADYSITQTDLGVFEVTGLDGTDILTTIEFAEFDDETVRLLRGSGVRVNFETDDPSVYQDALTELRDFGGNQLGGDGSWLRIGSADVNGDGDIDQILVNDAIGRFATVGTAEDGLIYFDDNGWAGQTRIAGIYIDPLVISGDVVQGSANDSQRRFQNDLEIENINQVLGADDYDGDGLQDVYFALTDGTAFLRAVMESDGNIRYANYQSQAEVIDFLTANGFGEETYGDWFGGSQNNQSEQSVKVPARALLPVEAPTTLLGSGDISLEAASLWQGGYREFPPEFFG